MQYYTWYIAYFKISSNYFFSHKKNILNFINPIYFYTISLDNKIKMFTISNILGYFILGGD